MEGRDDSGSPAYEPHQKRFLRLWFSWTRGILTAKIFLRKLAR